MISTKRWSNLALFLLLTAIATLSALPAWGAVETVIHSFERDPFGNQPSGELIADPSGNLYGVTFYGGEFDEGAVFQMIHNSQGDWSVKVIYSFKGNFDLAFPNGRLTFDPAGNIYGATAGGGLSGYGGLFELKRTSTGQWKESVLHVFQLSDAGYSPNGGLVFDQAGNLYGTTTTQGSGTCVFKLSPASGGHWVVQPIYQFSDGSHPNGNLVFDRAGNLYGATSDLFSANSHGTVYRLTPSSHGWSATILYQFTGGIDGEWPAGGVIFDAGGNLYGSTRGGGDGCNGSGCGTVFELTAGSRDSWAETVLYNFQGGAAGDGEDPAGTLTMDQAGNLYGVTRLGGVGTSAEGTVFRLSPSSGGQWSESLLWTFTGGSDGEIPPAGVTLGPNGSLFATASMGGSFARGTVIELTSGAGGTWHQDTLTAFPNPKGSEPRTNLIDDAAGNLYGTTGTGGIYGFGTVFKLAKSTNGAWLESVIYDFPDGSSPEVGVAPSALIFDAAGNLYGETAYGGAGHHGTVFELSPTTNGWKAKTLYTFNSQDGSVPSGGLIFDQSGNLYGTTEVGGNSGCGSSCGTVFQLTPGAASWSETALYRFAGGTDGANPVAGLIFDDAGNLYGTTSKGGQGNSGTVFQLSPSGQGWSETQLYLFTGNHGDGSGPMAGLVLDHAGNLYGTTSQGGTHAGECFAYGCGTVFQLSPATGGWKETVLMDFSQVDGSYPAGTLALDSHGNLYATSEGGIGSNWGSVIELSPRSGAWVENILHVFPPPYPNDPEGYLPFSGVIMDGQGNLYGTTVGGGPHNGGIVFQISQ